MNKDELERLIEILHAALVHYRLWDELMKRRDVGSVKIVNRGYATFIEYTRHAHYKSIFVELHKLIETRDDTYNLESVFKEIPESSVLIDRVKDYNEKFSAIKKGIFILRNNVFGHASRKLDPTQAFAKASISSADVERYIVESAKLLNQVKSEFFHTVDAYNEIGEVDSVAKLYAAMKAF